MDLDCENCWYFCYDEEEDVNYCEKDIDEDDFARMMSSSRKRCPFFIKADDYYLPRRQ